MPSVTICDANSDEKKEEKQFGLKKKNRLEVEVDNPQESKDDGGATKEVESASAIMSPPAVKESATSRSVNRQTGPRARSSLDTSLVRLTRNFANLLRSSAFGLLDLNYASEILKVPKRRLYDVINVLEGADLVTKEVKNSVQWLGPVARQDVALELTHLQETELKLDKLIQNCTLQIYQMFENQHAQRFAYLTYEDLSRIPCYQEQTVMVIKAPAGSQLDVPHPDENLCIHVVSRDGPIEVFLCSERPDSDRCHATDGQRASAKGSHAPPQAVSPPNHADAKDNPSCSSDAGSGPVGSPPAQETQRPPPAATSPSARRLAEDLRQSFVSLASPLNFGLGGEEDPGISDLFHSFDVEQMPLDLPV